MRDEESSERSDVLRLVRTLKRALRERGIRQRQIAKSLDVSEATVRRYLAGQGLTLHILEQLCQLADLRIIDLAEMAMTGEEGIAYRLTESQEAGLARNLMTAFVFYLLRYGWTGDEIRTECGLSESEIVAHLLALDRLHLIRLMPNNKVRILTARNPDWHQGGPVRRTFDRSARRIFQTIDYNAPEAMWELETLKLSSVSMVQLDHLMKDFAASVRALALDDRRQRRPQTRWHCVITAAHPVDPREMLGGPEPCPERESISE